MAKGDNSTLTNLEKTIENDYIGFNPSSNSTKPGYIANNLFRRCTGETCDASQVFEWIKLKRGKEEISVDELIDKYSSIIDDPDNVNPEEVKKFCFNLLNVFNQDNTVQATYDFSAFNITSHFLIGSSLQSEAKIGDFIFSILTKTIDGSDHCSAIELIQKTLKADDDDLTKLIKPIITFPPDSDIKDKISICDIDYLYGDKEKFGSWDKYKQTIRDSFETLTRNILTVNEEKNNLLVLERMVCLAVFSAFYYLVNLNAAKFGGHQAVIFIDSNHDLESIKKASEATFAIDKTMIESFYFNAINDILTNIYHIKNTKKDCIEWIDNMLFNDKKEDRDLETNSIKSYFESFYQEDKNNAVFALSKSLQNALYTYNYTNNSPSDFARVLGVRNGMLAPRGNRAKIKRFIFRSFTLQTLALSIIPNERINDGIGIEFDEFSKMIEEKFGIIFGTNIENDYQKLADLNIAQNTPGDLRGDMAKNANGIAEILISQGLGKNYADGVTLIGWNL